MSSYIRRQHTVAVAKADEGLLAELGYKQEFQREFTPLEVYFTSFLLLFHSPLATADIWGFVQYRWTLALYRVSAVPSSFLLQNYSLSSTARSSSILFPMEVRWRWSGG